MAKKAAARKKKASTSSASSKRRATPAPSAKKTSKKTAKTATAKTAKTAKKVTKKKTTKTTKKATGTTKKATGATKKAAASKSKKKAGGQKAPVKAPSGAKPGGGSSKKTTTKKAASGGDAKAPGGSKKRLKKASGGSAANGSAKPKKKKSGKGVEPAPTERYRSVYGSTADQGAQAAASLLKAMGIDRPASVGPAAADGDGEEARLTKSPLKKAQLRKFQEILRLKRAEILGDVTTLESEALNASGDHASRALSQHMADQGSDAYEQSLALDLVASQRDLIKEIDAALDRIDRGTYGICEASGRAINIERLENTPWARLSIEAAREAERMSFRR